MSNESFFDKVKDFVKGHPEQADQGLDKAGEFLDERTGGQYSEHIAQGRRPRARAVRHPGRRGERPDARAGSGSRRPARRPRRPDADARHHARAPHGPDAHGADHDAAGSQPRPGADVAARDGARSRAGHVERAARAAGLSGPNDQRQPVTAPAVIPRMK